MASAKTGLDRLFGRATRIWSSGRGGRKADRQRVLASGLFDAAWYRATYPDVARAGLDPLDHYLKHGGREGRAAGPGFHGAAYLALNPDVARAGSHPLLHYLSYGRAEKRSLPVGDDLRRLGFDALTAEETGLVARLAASPLFDAAWYAERHPDMAASGVAPAVHYVRSRGDGCRHPGPAFDARRYAADHPDVAASGVDPFLHYLSHGQAEGRAFHPVDPAEAAAPPADALTALVEQSGLFDATWYASAYPEVGRSGLTPLEHFVREGLPRGYDPGPGFDATHYAALYPEVEAAGVLPFVHYVEHGRAEGRSPLPSRSSPAAAGAIDETWLGRIGLSEEQAARMVRESPLFNADWYMARHLDVARSDLQADLHYVRHGGPEGRPPSLHFDPAFYRSQMPEANGPDVDPLIHFLLFGRAAGARPHPLLDGPPRLAPLHRDAYPIVAPAESVDAAVDCDTVSSPPDDAAWISLSGMPLVPVCEPARTLLHAATVEAFWQLSGKPGAAPITVPGSEAGALDAGGGLAPGAFDLTALAVADVWFADAGTLRIRQEVSAGGAMLRAYQIDAESGEPRPVLVDGGRAGGLRCVDVRLAAPLHPVLLVGWDAERGPSAVLLPFPSLCRGGLHHAELVAGRQLAAPLDEMARRSHRLARAVLAVDDAERWIGRVEVDRRTALGSEPILAPETARWLRAVFGVEVSAAGSSAAEPAIGTLLLPPDCVPTLEALAAGRGPTVSAGAATIGPFLVAEALTGKPVASVRVPSLDPIWTALQPRRGSGAFPQVLPAGQRPATARAFPWAIRCRPAGRPMDASLLNPHAPDNPEPILAATPAEPVAFRLAAVIRVTDPAHLPGLIDSLADQAKIEIEEILLLVEATDGTDWAAMVEARLDVPVRVLPRSAEDWPDLKDLAELVAAPLTLFLEGSIVLHDRRTVTVLGTIARAPGIASAAAATVHETFSKHGSLLSVETGGYMPGHVGFAAGPGLILSLPEIGGALPDATVPVIANRLACCMVRTAVLRDIDLSAAGSFGSIPEVLRFGLAALRSGHRHAATTAVRAGDRHPLGVKEAVDPIALSALDPHGLDGLLGAVTVVAEVR